MTIRTSGFKAVFIAVGLGACGTTAPPPPPVAPAPAPAPPAAPAVVAAAPLAPTFTEVAAAQSALVGSLVSVAPAKIISDLDALSQRLDLPMLLGRELLTALGGMGIMGDATHFKDFWESLDSTTPLAVVWVMPPRSPVRGFCAALTFRETAGARRALDDLGKAGAERDGVAERLLAGGDVVWGGVKGRTLFVSNSPEALRLGGGLAESAQATPPAAQLVARIEPQALLAASGRTKDALLAEAKAVVAQGTASGQGAANPGIGRMTSALVETVIRLGLDSSTAHLSLEVGPRDGLMLQAELVPLPSTDLAARIAKRSPYAFDGKLPVRDDQTAVIAFGTPTAWLSLLPAMFEATGPAGKDLWRSSSKIFESTSEWSCMFEPAEAGFATLCTAGLKQGITSRAALDTAVALAKAQQAWEGELYGQKLSPLKIKRAGEVVEIEKKLEAKDKVALAMAKAIAGGDTLKTVYSVKDGRLVQATGRDPRKTLVRYGKDGGLKGAPLLTAALARTQSAEMMAAIDVVAVLLRLLGQNKDLPGSQLAGLAGALPGLAEMKAPFLFSLRTGNALTADYRIPLGSLENVARVVRGMYGTVPAK
jgi:hypothetical protein